MGAQSSKGDDMINGKHRSWALAIDGDILDIIDASITQQFDDTTTKLYRSAGIVNENGNLHAIILTNGIVMYEGSKDIQDGRTINIEWIANPMTVDTRRKDRGEESRRGDQSSRIGQPDSTLVKDPHHFFVDGGSDGFD